MADLPTSPDIGNTGNTGDETARGPSRTATAVYPGTPRWVKVFGVVALVLVLLFLGVHLVRGGTGPGAHLSHLGGRSAPPMAQLSR